MSWTHYIVVPVVLPLAAGCIALLLEPRWPRAAARLSVAVSWALLALAGYLATIAASGVVTPYLLGNWRAPFGIALALDRLSALMLVLTAVVAVGAALYARGGGHGSGGGAHDARGRHFHALFQFQLMGLNGAFLTADLFNLFVFFEVLLIASYGLLLHGGGARRLRASIHYVVFNLTGSTLFLIAVALLYGLTGTLNMADLALRVPVVAAQHPAQVQAAALILIVVFGVKAALLPLYFWLPDTYSAATAPAAALFAIMTKVGVYCIARVTTLVFGAEAGGAADVAYPWLPALAMATLVLATFGALAAYRLRLLVAYLVVSSAGTLLLAVGLGSAPAVGAALFYLINSTLVAAALFLLIDSIACARGEARDWMVPAPLAYRAAYGALFFLVAAEAASVPPLGGFLGKSLLLAAVVGEPMAGAVWIVVLATGLGIIVALARAGSTVFWEATAANRMQMAAARPAVSQRAALAWLTVAIIATVFNAGPVGGYTGAAAAQLLQRHGYIEAVLGAEPVTPLWNPRAGAIKP